MVPAVVLYHRAGFFNFLFRKAKSKTFVTVYGRILWEFSYFETRRRSTTLEEKKKNQLYFILPLSTIRFGILSKLSLTVCAACQYRVEATLTANVGIVLWIPPMQKAGGMSTSLKSKACN